eukprot:6174018-Pleurochrysis_carterae.AAC.1
MDKCSKLTRHTGRVASNANCDASKRVVAVPSAQAEDDARREDEHVLRKHAVCDPLPNNLIAQLLRHARGKCGHVHVPSSTAM